MLNQNVFILFHIFVSSVASSFAIVCSIICCSVFFFCIILAWCFGDNRKRLIMTKLTMKHIEYVLYYWLQVKNVKIAELTFCWIDGLAIGHPTKYAIVHVLGFWVVVKRRYNESKSDSRRERVRYFNYWELLY